MASDIRQIGGVDDIEGNEPINREVTTEDQNTSDNDGGERPVRNKLKETSINPTPAGDNSRASSRGRKRSFDDSQTERRDDNSDPNENSGHRRKRSRDSKNEDDEMASSEGRNNQGGTPPNAGEISNNILSPKKKRSRDQLDKEDSKEQGVATESINANLSENTGKTQVEGEPEKKRHRDDSQERESAIPPKVGNLSPEQDAHAERIQQASITSAFSSTSAVSPFGSIGPSKMQTSKDEGSNQTTQTTSSSAFAASSLAAFASSEKSPFGSLGGSTTSIFKSAASTDTEKPAATGFAAASRPSPFATTGASGFATLGSGFSGFGSGFAAAGQTGGLTSFASPNAPPTLGSTATKPFGAADDAESENENEDDENEAVPQGFEKETPDERFSQQQQIHTGEEEEKTQFTCKAKLFAFQDKEWKERGIGTFKVNVKESDDEKEGKTTARMIMRADGVLRVILNIPIFKGMTIGDPKGNEPKTKQINFASFEDGRSVPLLLRTGSEDLAKQLYHVVRDLQEKL